MNGQREED